MDADIYYDDLGKDMRVEPIPEDMVDLANEYREKLLSLFRERGLDLNAEQLDMLLLLRQKTDQMLLERKAERQESKP